MWLDDGLGLSITERRPYRLQYTLDESAMRIDTQWSPHMHCVRLISTRTIIMSLYTTGHLYTPFNALLHPNPWLYTRQCTPMYAWIAHYTAWRFIYAVIIMANNRRIQCPIIGYAPPGNPPAGDFISGTKSPADGGGRMYQWQTRPRRHLMKYFFHAGNEYILQLWQRHLQVWKKPQRQYCVLSEDRRRRCDLDLWPFDRKINGFPGLIVEHLCVKVGYHRWCIVCKNRQTNSAVNRYTSTIVVGVSNKIVIEANTVSRWQTAKLSSLHR